MVQAQIINKILQSKDITILQDNQLDISYFPEYTEEYTFVLEHFDKYKNIPDKATFKAKFPDFEMVEVTESDKYLIDTIREEHLFYTTLPIMKEMSHLLEVDANKASEFLISRIKELQPNYSLGGTDIISQAKQRYDEFIEKRDNQKNWFFTTGFPELDDVTHGIQRKEEFIVIVARTNQGKSWVLEKICTHIWEIGFNVGYISPEMGASSVGYRFDTLHRNYSNKQLMWGNKDFNDKDYKMYTEELKTAKNGFFVATKDDLGKQITVSTIRNFIKQHKLDIIAIDGITYMTDERAVRGDNKTTMLTHISEDLMALSIEMSVPVLVVVQANRGGADVDDDSVPDLEHIRDSDGISHNASKVLSLKQSKDGVLTIQVKKQRNGIVGTKVRYIWNADSGEFISMNDNSSESRPKKREIKKNEDVF